jgi:hypothetical protein
MSDSKMTQLEFVLQLYLCACTSTGTTVFNSIQRYFLVFWRTRNCNANLSRIPQGSAVLMAYPDHIC